MNTREQSFGSLSSKPREVGSAPEAVKLSAVTFPVLLGYRAMSGLLPQDFQRTDQRWLPPDRNQFDGKGCLGNDTVELLGQRPVSLTPWSESLLQSSLPPRSFHNSLPDAAWRQYRCPSSDAA